MQKVLKNNPTRNVALRPTKHFPLLLLHSLEKHRGMSSPFVIWIVSFYTQIFNWMLICEYSEKLSAENIVKNKKFNTFFLLSRIKVHARLFSYNLCFSKIFHLKNENVIHFLNHLFAIHILKVSTWSIFTFPLKSNEKIRKLWLA